MKVKYCSPLSQFSTEMKATEAFVQPHKYFPLSGISLQKLEHSWLVDYEVHTALKLLLAQVYFCIDLDNIMDYILVGLYI